MEQGDERREKGHDGWTSSYSLVITTRTARMNDNLCSLEHTRELHFAFLVVPIYNKVVEFFCCYSFTSY